MLGGVRRFAALVLGVGCVVFGCGGGTSGGSGAICGEAQSKFASCGFKNAATALGAPGGCEEPTDSFQRCAANCLLSLACSALDSMYCGNDGSAAQACASKCQPPPLACADGSQAPGGQKCDGFPDCGDGSDEVGCPTFKCADGSEVNQTDQCNGWDDCSDGSDEVGCPTFKCADGSEVPESSKCDSWDDCSDGSDELNCSSGGPSLSDAFDQDCMNKGYPPGGGGP